MRALFLDYLSTILIGGSGALVSFVLTGLLTEFVFGRDSYLIGYSIGIAAGLAFAFTLFIRQYRIHSGYAGMLLRYLVYMLTLIAFQTWLIKTLVAWLGVDWYFVIMACVLLVLSCVNYPMYTRVIFRHNNRS